MHINFIKIVKASVIILLPFLVIAQESWSVRMAESVMERHPNRYRYDWDYVAGTVLRGFEELWYDTGDERYYNYIQNTVDYVVNNNGEISGYDLYSYNIDEINEGRMVLFMYKNTGLEKYKTAAQLLRSQLENHPRTTDGGFWHKQRYPWQMWLDGLYMGSPFYAEYGLVLDESEAFDDVSLQLRLMERHGRDPITGLLYHGWDESKEQDWADPVTGQSPSFWGRGIGWYAMALVDVLDFLPQAHADRDSIIGIVNRLADAMFEFQDDDTGLWWQVVDKGDSTDNYLESSVSTMMVYSMAKAIRLGYLDNTYLPNVVNAYEGILNHFITVNTDSTINLTQTCCTAGLGNGRDGSYNYYINETSICTNDGKGVGPFITASIEIERMSLPKKFSAETLSGSSIKLTWSNPEGNFEGYQIQRATGTEFVEIDQISINDSSYTDEELNPLTLYSYRIRPYIGDQFGIYSKVVQASTLGENGEPAYPLNPYPPDGSSNEALDVQLSWEAGEATLSHNVYFGESNPPDSIGNQDETTFNPGMLDELTTYYWRINEVNNAGVTIGPVWEFTTKMTSFSPTLVAYWPFNENSGSTVSDQSEFENDGSMINMDGSAWQTGIAGSGLQFDGIDDHVTVPHDDVFNFGVNSFSISFWIKQTVQDKHMRYIIKGTHSDPGTGRRYEVFHHSSNVVRFSIDDNVNKTVAEASNTNFVTGDWVHVVAVRDTDDDIIKLYADKELQVSTEDITGDISQDEQLLFGVSPDEENTNYEGFLDEIKFFNYAVNDSMIEALYNKGITSIQEHNTSIKSLQLNVKNYPNPFNPKTTIFFSIPATGEAALTVYNIIGQKMEVLFNKNINKGEYTFEYDAFHLSSGVYFFLLECNGSSQTRKFVLVK
ncbi:MAG: glycoside hydrolase family 88 protein [Calditrichaceae bacterium]